MEHHQKDVLHYIKMSEGQRKIFRRANLARFEAMNQETLVRAVQELAEITESTLAEKVWLTWRRFQSPEDEKKYYEEYQKKKGDRTTKFISRLPTANRKRLLGLAKELLQIQDELMPDIVKARSQFYKDGLMEELEPVIKQYEHGY
jgi:hypothetical protein